MQKINDMGNTTKAAAEFNYNKIYLVCIYTIAI